MRPTTGAQLHRSPGLAVSRHTQPSRNTPLGTDITKQSGAITQQLHEETPSHQHSTDSITASPISPLPLSPSSSPPAPQHPQPSIELFHIPPQRQSNMPASLPSDMPLPRRRKTKGGRRHRAQRPPWCEILPPRLLPRPPFLEKKRALSLQFFLQIK